MNGTIDINLGQKPTLTTAIHNYSASGTTANVDLSNYYTKVESDAKLNGKVGVIYGKGLSTNDYTTEEKTKLNSLSNYDDSGVNKSINDEAITRHNTDNSLINSLTDEVIRAEAAEAQLQKNIDGKTIDLSDYVTSSELTKYETSTAHTADITTLQSSIDGKLNKSDYAPVDLSPYYNKSETDSKLLTKIDVAEGKGLSTNDYTTVEKNKLNSLNNYDDSIVNNSINNEVARATAAESQLQKNIDEKQAKGDFVSTSQLSDYETITGHSADITTLNSAIDSKLNKTDYTPTDLSNYYKKTETSGATQIANAIAAIQTTKVLTQVEYDAIAVKDNNTTYLITA